MGDFIVFIIIAVAAGFVFCKLKSSAKSGKCSGGCSCDSSDKDAKSDNCCK